MAVKYDAICKLGTYKNASGEEKIKWVKVGVVMETRNNGLALKIEQLPVPFDGWIQFSVPKPKDGVKPDNSKDPLEDDIPF